MNYTEANEKLQGRCKYSRKVGNNTYLERDSMGEEVYLRLHSTRILTYYPDGRVGVTTGRWNTNTTLNRLNRYLPSPYKVARDSSRFGGTPVLCAGWHTPLAVLPCVIPANGEFSQVEHDKVDALIQQTREARNARNRERYKERFWILKARQGGKPNKPLTLEMIQNESNVTTRTAMIKVYGMERFMTQIKAQVLDTHGEYALISYALDSWQNIRALKMVCPSTKTVYIHPVAPRCGTVSDALDWMFQTENYLERLQIEA